MPTYVLETPTFAPNGHDSGSPPVFLILLGSELQACNRDRRVLCALCAPILFFALRCSGAVLIYSVFRAFLPRSKIYGRARRDGCPGEGLQTDGGVGAALRQKGMNVSVLIFVSKCCLPSDCVQRMMQSNTQRILVSLAGGIIF